VNVFRTAATATARTDSYAAADPTVILRLEALERRLEALEGRLAAVERQLADREKVPAT
jgi:hypothetical protein